MNKPPLIYWLWGRDVCRYMWQVGFLWGRRKNVRNGESQYNHALVLRWNVGLEVR